MKRPKTVFPRVELENVSYEINGAAILTDVNLVIDTARTGIIGANGSGKSTLLRLIAGLIAPSKGRVRIDGIDPFKERDVALQSLGMIFQNPDHQIIFPTIGEELAFGLRQQGRKKDEANEIVKAFLERYQRASWFERPVNNLSQGERHLVCLMAVMLMEPKTILFDEPYAGLDLAMQIQLHRNIESLSAQAILVSHEAHALSSVERLIWIENGCVFREGTIALLADYNTAMRERAAQYAELDLTL